MAREFNVSKHCPVNMEDVGRAMRRPGLLLRADEMFPHAVGHVLAAIGTCMQGGRLVGDRSVAWLHVRLAVCLMAVLARRSFEGYLQAPSCRLSIGAVDELHHAGLAINI